MEKNTFKAILNCIPCEVSRLAGRIKNRDWSYKDVSACKYMDENKSAHRLTVMTFVAILAFAVFASGAATWIVVLVAVLALVINLAKIKNFIRDKFKK